jgi:glycosyltransferase involved in cell wall biosynthesis
MKSEARITVVLPVFNGGEYLREAIQSVLCQTFSRFILLVIDDGSTDSTKATLESFDDSRLRVVTFTENRGIVAALNFGIGEARTEFIARMDADDICVPSRFERQLRFMEQHSTISICGSWMHEFGDRSGPSRPPLANEAIRARLFFGWAMNHPTMMMRHSHLSEYGLKYSAEYPYAEDLDLLIRASRKLKLANLPEPLVYYRKHAGQSPLLHSEEQSNSVNRLLIGQLRELLPEWGQQQEGLHLRVANSNVSSDQLDEAEKWLMKLRTVNRKRKVFDRREFERGLAQWWFDIHYHSSQGPGVLKSYWRSPLARSWGIGLKDKVKIVIKNCVMR